MTECRRRKDVLIGVGLGGAALVLAAASALLGAQRGVHHADQTTEQLRQERDQLLDKEQQRAGQQQAVIDEYRREQCLIIAALPTPVPAPVVDLRDHVLRCDTAPTTPLPPTGLRPAPTR